MGELEQLMIEHFPFLTDEEISNILELCHKNNRLFYESDRRFLLGYVQFYPELINAVRLIDFDVLLKCDLTEGPLVFVAVLITPGNALRIISEIVRGLNARAYAFHRHKDEEYEFHFVRNNRYTQSGLIKESIQ